MAATVVGIVYSKNQQVIRRIIHTRWLGYTTDANGNRTPIPDPKADDSQLQHHKNAMHPNEAWAEIPFADYDAITNDVDIHTHLGLTGIPRVTDRCIVHDGKNVVAVVCGDPTIDTHPLGTLVADTTGQAAVGLPVANGVAQIPVPPPVTTGGSTAPASAS